MTSFQKNCVITYTAVPKILNEISYSNGGEYEGDLSSGLLRRVVWWNLTDVSEVHTASNIPFQSS
jgi:hypothetical protein